MPYFLGLKPYKSMEELATLSLTLFMPSTSSSSPSHLFIPEKKAKQTLGEKAVHVNIFLDH
jgi:hypothetical protein